ncbi:hypothetical protein BU25DRAFT_405412 [Macroventuria anomochaeta]|uniref:Uncharacterized protein n=1 Tax=Macroventuria anomochaeta TaxID=301207 RepID=A0ACB6SIZ9_9PLEO|nr:uncharacterized protein BU25DRAFT_405412 [Macroventuria anomochaeta]KAF2633537.1 hypothetical protein BU25DRAFT_405412 [Macroventuria anomochaeta]
MHCSASITLIYINVHSLWFLQLFFILHLFHHVLKLSTICQPSASHRATVSSQRLGPPFRKLLFHATHWLPNLRGNRGAEGSLTR